MATIKITGSSDDNVHVLGKVDGCDEYGHYSSDPAYVELSTGDVFEVVYDNEGIWRVRHHVETGFVVIKQFEQGSIEDDTNDWMTIDGPIAWIDFWEEWPASIKGKAIKFENIVEPLKIYEKAALYDTLMNMRRSKKNG